MIQTQEVDTIASQGTRKTRGRKASSALARLEPAMQADEELRSLRLAKRLGWFSIGLGVTQIAAPEIVARLIGLRPTARAKDSLRLIGVREITAGLGILARRRPTGWLWGRVAGDLMDLTLLAGGGLDGVAGRRRAAIAAASIIGITAMDVGAARKLGGVDREHAGASAEQRRLAHTQSITLNAAVDAVMPQWRDFLTRESPRIGDVRIAAAPGGRGTEIHVEHGTLQALGVKSLLRRFKQIVETGEVVKSDASIHVGPHPAQPPSRLEKGDAK